ncbi:DUF2157 domain-containing protein [Reichenbachiella agarivorans]|uniref:DUF2157 domain-containing protein n=1 Tax=Reichenbachiella agarivorans TaxID=2979464 RepID=A0ABY6CR31_9BACT|nr:DUF2157 domain-containing protein [Reichenbachiella agarivorans]UXP32500.1 DUF2157 domain-containing protein [Reichenbachiella agarivorans]
MDNLHQKLFEEKLLDEQPFRTLEAIHSKKLVSLYYELRLVLYLGILLFTGGVGYIVYQNVGEIGHYAMMLLLAVAIGVGGYYIRQHARPYFSGEVKVEHIYFDYVLVLVALLIISLFTYVQVYFDLVWLLLKWTSVISGLLFAYMAYRYDSKIVLSLSITAWAAVFGLSVSPVDWVNGEWVDTISIYTLALYFGLFLLVLGIVMEKMDIKKHFIFTYHNFALLLIYFAGLAMMFDWFESAWVAFVLLVFTVLVAWRSWNQRVFLFFLYSCFVGYIALSFLIFTAGEEIWEFGFFYFPASCIAGVILLVKNRTHFSDDN